MRGWVCLICVVGSLLQLAGCLHTIADAYSCERAHIALGLAQVATTPVTLDENPSLFPVQRDARLLRNRQSLQVTVDAIHIELGDLCRDQDSQIFNADLLVKNHGTQSHSLSLSGIRFVPTEPSPSRDEGKLAVRSIWDAWVSRTDARGYFVGTTRYASDSSRYSQPGSTRIPPGDTVEIKLDIKVAEFQSGILAIPIISSDEGHETLLEFEIQHAVTYRKGRY